MRGAIVFAGSSHPKLVEGICDRLGTKQGSATLGKFKNGETSVTIRTSSANVSQDALTWHRHVDPKQRCLHCPEWKREVGSSLSMLSTTINGNRINDSVMELLIMISACKGGSAKSVTGTQPTFLNSSLSLTHPAVMPYFPYSRQSKKKQHRGAITARMVANLLHVAGVNHVITLDLHASQMQGFFKCPVDNLVAEPLLARWIRVNVPNWREAVVVSKNPGGTKRVTSLADALKLSFGIVTTDRRRAGTAVHWNESAMYEQLRLDSGYEPTALTEPAIDLDAEVTPISKITHEQQSDPGKPKPRAHTQLLPLQRRTNGISEQTGSPLSKSMRASSIIEPEVPLEPIRTNVSNLQEDEDPSADESAEEEYTDEVRILVLGFLANANSNSAQETSFMDVWYKVTLSMTRILLQQSLRPRTQLGAIDRRPRAMRTFLHK
jgi:ribose-phosphate pyrophosphokinase